MSVKDYCLDLKGRGKGRAGICDAELFFLLKTFVDFAGKSRIRTRDLTLLIDWRLVEEGLGNPEGGLLHKWSAQD
ncbi:hypothetical protein Ddc_12755 [Ditylenchus destructor]|nr:hypothetical protein Ddc_12755 [Ditylenchus destructor]